MSRKISDLTTEMADKANAFVSGLDARGQGALIYCTLRTFEEQAILFRQSRPTRIVEHKAGQLRTLYGRDDLADILLGVGPHSGPHVTNAAPGESLHNYGLAFDCVPTVNGAPMWSYSANRHLYELMGEVALEVGLEWAGTWTKFKEYVHFQAPSTNWRELITQP